MQEVGADDLKEQKTEKATPLKKNAHWEIQCFLILPFAVSPPIIFISLRQSALSGEGPARRSAASKRPFFPTVTARAQGFLSQTHPPLETRRRGWPRRPKSSLSQYTVLPQSLNSLNLKIPSITASARSQTWKAGAETAPLPVLGSSSIIIIITIIIITIIKKNPGL